MIDTWTYWAVLIIGIIIVGFFGLGTAVFLKIERRIEKWFVLGLVIGIGLITGVLLL